MLLSGVLPFMQIPAWLNSVDQAFSAQDGPHLFGAQGVFTKDRGEAGAVFGDGLAVHITHAEGPAWGGGFVHFGTMDQAVVQ